MSLSGPAEPCILLASASGAQAAAASCSMWVLQHVIAQLLSDHAPTCSIAVLNSSPSAKTRQQAEPAAHDLLESHRTPVEHPSAHACRCSTLRCWTLAGTGWSTPCAALQRSAMPWRVAPMPPRGRWRRSMESRVLTSGPTWQTQRQQRRTSMQVGATLAVNQPV